MNTRSRSLIVSCRAVAVIAAFCVLPSCRSLTESVSKEQVAKDRVSKESSSQESGAKLQASKEAEAPTDRTHRDLNVRLVSDEQSIATAPPPLPLAINHAKTIAGRPPKPIAGAKLPALPRDYDGANCAPPIPYGVVTPWAPPGIKGPWPHDEYLHDGGDAEEPVAVSPEWRVQGLNVEDTVAHYDTIDGRTLVEQSNCAYIYAPRFSSVRTVTNLVSSEFIDGPNKIVENARISTFDEKARVGTKLEQQQPVGRIANVKLSNYRRDQGINLASTALMPHSYQQSFSPFENLSVIRSGTMLGAEKARLAERSESAIAWSKADGVKVFLEKQQAVVSTGDKRAQAIYVVKGPTDARLRICKIASTPAALPGDVIDFTIRYDNIGDQTVGNVVILDSLTTRLAYVPDSAQSSRKAYFNAMENAAESLELRWEIDEPIKPGEGGLVRFKCKVR